MIERDRLNRLVVGTISDNGNLRAIQIYEIIRSADPRILIEEKVRGFRSFVKIINQFPDVEHVGTFQKEYVVRKA
jgi:hypothetical protein